MLTERDHRLVALVARFRLLSRDQLMALAPFGSLTRANTRLAALVRMRALARKNVPVYPGHGSAQALYHLGRKAREVVPSISASSARTFGRSPAGSWPRSSTR
jgi:hypothetical protein